MADTAKPEKQRRVATALVAALGGLGLLWLMRPDGPIAPPKRDTKAERADTLKLLETNIGIPGGVALNNYLIKDGFIDFTWKPAGVPIGNNSQLILGAGTGKTVWPHALDALEAFNRPGGGTKLRAAIAKAIAGSPQDDDPASRALVMAWLDTFVAAGDPGFKELVDDLTNGNWATGKYVPPIPPATVPKPFIHLSIQQKATTILDYPKWLRDVNTRTLLDRIDPLAFPKDPTRPGRDLIWLQVQLVASQKLPGFDSLSTILEGVGWHASPYNKKIPSPGTVIAPLGGISSIDMSTVDYTVAGVGALVERAINTYDPTLPPRVKALAALKAVASHKWAKYFVNFDVLASALETAGFVESPRGTKTVPGGGAKDFYVAGVIEERPVWSARPTQYATLQDFVSLGSAAEVQQIAQAADTYTKEAFTRWVVLQTFMNVNIWSPDIKWITRTPEGASEELIKRGFLMNPPQQEPAFKLNENPWAIDYTGNPNGNNPGPIFDSAALFKAKIPYQPPPNVPPMYGLDLLQRSAWQAYWIAAAPGDFDPKGLNNAPGVTAATISELKNGAPVIGVAGATFADIASQVTTPPALTIG